MRNRASRTAMTCLLVATVIPVCRVVAQSQAQPLDARARVLVAGQPDSASLALVEAIRRGLRDENPSLLIVPQASLDLVLSEGYRMRTDPISFSDIRELGKLVRADIVIGLGPRTTN